MTVLIQAAKARIVSRSITAQDAPPKGIGLVEDLVAKGVTSGSCFSGEVRIIKDFIEIKSVGRAHSEVVDRRERCDVDESSTSHFCLPNLIL